LALKSRVRIPLVIRTAMIVLLGIAPAFAGSPGRYDDYSQGVYLPYVNAPGPGGNITTVPRLRISFGERSYDAVMDTGSTGVVVSADKIPNMASLQSLGAGELTYSSSGRIMVGQWVVTPMTIMGADGTRITTAPIAVLAVTRIACTPRARRCTPNEAPRRVSMLGMGFGRRSDAQSGVQKNPFLNIAKLNGVNGEHIRRGYIVTRRGVHVGLTAANTQGDFSYVKLAPAPDGQGWAATPACISVNEAKPAACGSLLMDTGVTAVYLTVPEAQAPADIRTIDGVGPTLVPGTKLTISIPAEEAPQALYSFALGDDLNPLAPRKLNLVERRRPPFINTSVSFLNGFDFLYDADGGFVGLRWTGHAPPAFGKAAPSSPSN
jgi:predicted aspartyl protease